MGHGVGARDALTGGVGLLVHQRAIRARGHHAEMASWAGEVAGRGLVMRAGKEGVDSRKEGTREGGHSGGADGEAGEDRDSVA